MMPGDAKVSPAFVEDIRSRIRESRDRRQARADRAESAPMQARDGSTEPVPPT
jgi:hypothetical protein